MSAWLQFYALVDCATFHRCSLKHLVRLQLISKEDEGGVSVSLWYKAYRKNNCGKAPAISSLGLKSLVLVLTLLLASLCSSQPPFKQTFFPSLSSWQRAIAGWIWFVVSQAGVWRWSRLCTLCNIYWHQKMLTDLWGGHGRGCGIRASSCRAVHAAGRLVGFAGAWGR